MHLPILIFSPLQIAGILLGLAGLAYLVLALYFTSRFRDGPGPIGGQRPPVSVLKPVHGSAPFLYDCLRSFCDQDWPEYEIIFGVHTDSDPAIAVVERLIAEFPDRNLRLVIDAAPVLPEHRHPVTRVLVAHIGGDVVTRGNLPAVLIAHIPVAAQSVLSVAHRSSSPRARPFLAVAQLDGSSHLHTSTAAEARAPPRGG